MIRHILAVAACGLVAGCGSLTGFSDEYDCPGRPSGVACMSARDVYAATNERESIVSLSDKDKKSDENQDSAPKTADPRKPFVPAPLIAEGQIPIRTPAHVLRIWIAPYEDADGDLHMPGLVFTEVQPRRWQVGLPAAVRTRTARPLADE